MYNKKNKNRCSTHLFEGHQDNNSRTLRNNCNSQREYKENFSSNNTPEIYQKNKLSAAHLEVKQEKGQYILFLKNKNEKGNKTP